MSKVTLSVNELNQVANSLSALINKELPFKVSYILSKLIKKVDKELEVLNEVKQRIVTTHVTLDDKGQPVPAANPQTGIMEYTFKDDETKASYLQELTSLSKMPIIIEHLTIPQRLLEKVDISPMQLSALSFLIEEEEAEGKKE